MLHRLRFFIKYGAYWLIFFLFARALFLFYNSNHSAELGFSDIFMSMIHGFRLDLSAMGYLLLLPGLFLTFLSFFSTKVLRKSLAVYHYIILSVATLVVISDMELYSHWGFRLDTSPLLYLNEDFTMPLGMGKLLFLVMVGLLIISLFSVIYKYFITPEFDKQPVANWKASLLSLFLTAAMVAPIRGTTGVAPINTGTVYFHNNNLFANHSAVNVLWNVGYDLKKFKKLKYPENYFESKKSKSYFGELYREEGETRKLLKTERPNVVLIILESFTYKFVEPLGGIPGVAPNLSKVATEGILFTNAYASGDRTDKGLVSILSGFPAQPHTSIIKFANKTEKLPFLNKSFRALGYETSFTYGGDIDFANFRSYLLNAQFDDITHSEHFADSLNTFKWGVHDEYVFERFEAEIGSAKKPFFKVMLSSSSHEPFEVPMEPVFPGEDDESKFLNSAHYTDRELGEFLKSAKQSDWWENTLVIITADHGHPLMDNEGTVNPKRFKIPMVWTGGAVAENNLTIDNLISQTDIANTVLGQLNAQNPDFLFSHNALCENYNDFVIYVYNDGFGYLDDNKHVVYDNVSGKYLITEGVESDKDLEVGKAFLQTLYTNYNKN